MKNPALFLALPQVEKIFNVLLIGIKEWDNPIATQIVVLMVRWDWCAEMGKFLLKIAKEIPLILL